MIDRNRIIKKLKTTIFGENLFCLQEVNSTNNYALKLAKEGAPEGTVVCTEYQTAGKGRLNRQWLSRPGENFLVSIIIRPEQEIDSVQKITLASANILIEAIESFFKTHRYKKLKVDVKWPNDLLVDGKKIAGILAESILRDKNIETLVIGFGLNLNTIPGEMPMEIRETATSLIEYTGKPVVLEDFLAHFLNHFERSYFKLERTNYSNVVSAWKKHCDQFGDSIIIQTPDGKEEGCFHDVNDAGHLIYRRTDGELIELISGDIKKV